MEKFNIKKSASFQISAESLKFEGRMVVAEAIRKYS